MVHDTMISAPMVFISVLVLVTRCARGFSVRYVPYDLIVVVITFFDVYANLVWYRDITVAVASSFSLAVWVYITWKDWNKRQKRRALKFAGEKGRLAIARMARSMPRVKAPRWAPQPVLPQQEERGKKGNGNCLASHHHRHHRRLDG